MEESKKYPIREIQLCELEILKAVKRVCEKYNFTFYLGSGTLLGAVRHKGFIPWDDDIDIGIPRKDYDRFINEIEQELPQYLKLNTYWDDSSHHYYFSRIVDTRHELKRSGSLVERNEEVWVDIFPLDGMPNGLFKRKLHMIRLLYARMRYHLSTFEKVNLKRPNRPLSERIIIKIVYVTRVGTHSDPIKWLNKIDKLLRMYSIDSTNWVCNFMGQYKFKEMFPKNWYGNGKLYEFEDGFLNGPIEYDKILTQQYGDYMKPPAEKNVHATEFIR